MKLQKFGKLIKKQYGIIAPELLNNLYDFYTDSPEEFNKRFKIDFNENLEKGFYLNEDLNDKSNILIVFGYKHINTDTKFETIKGKIIAKRENSKLVIGEEFIFNNDLILLDMNSMKNKIEEYKLITENKI